MAGPAQPEKLCPSCGFASAADANVCSKCGYNFNTGPYSRPPGQGFGAPPPPGYMNPPGQAPPQWQANYPRGGYDGYSSSADGFAIASLVVGILSIVSFCVWCLAIPGGGLALIFGALGLKGRNRALAISGMICGGFAILLGVALVVFWSTVGPRSSRF